MINTSMNWSERFGTLPIIHVFFFQLRFIIQTCLKEKTASRNSLPIFLTFFRSIASIPRSAPFVHILDTRESSCYGFIFSPVFPRLDEADEITAVREGEARFIYAVYPSRSSGAIPQSLFLQKKIELTGKRSSHQFLRYAR